MADIWMGTQERAEFVPCVDLGANASRVGFIDNGVFLNGGAYSEKSTTGHKEYSYAWHRKDRDALKFILELSNDVHGTGLIHWNPPEAMDRNVLPSYFSAPRIAANKYSDAPSFLRDQRPLLVNTPNNVNELPNKSAGYRITSDPYVNPGQSIYIPIPPTSVLHFGYKGVATGSAIMRMIQFDKRGQVGAYTDVTPIDYLSPTLTNAVVFGTEYSGVRIYLTRWDERESSMILSGLTAQVIPISSPNPTGRWSLGEGHSGCRFKGWPGMSLPGRMADKMGLGLTAEFIEVGAWETDANETENDVSTLFATLARDPDQLVNGAIARNVDGAPVSFNVRWPDGVKGVYTALTINSQWPYLVDSYNVTYGGVKTFFQPPVERDSNSLIINAPEIVEL